MKIYIDPKNNNNIFLYKEIGNEVAMDMDESKLKIEQALRLVKNNKNKVTLLTAAVAAVSTYFATPCVAIMSIPMAVTWLAEIFTYVAGITGICIECVTFNRLQQSYRTLFTNLLKISFGWSLLYIIIKFICNLV